ncbi:MAG TPA: DUF1801 domain-containing protein [Saprospiraceae bacterium]|nr:DUF1801 domain-containing protein [Saprospiraceae bacterium]
MKAKNKTTQNEGSVADFIASLEEEQQQKDSLQLVEILQKVTGHPPKMWGGSIIGFDKYKYIYASGREGEHLKIGFSPRKGKLSIYLMTGVNKHKEDLDRMGPYKTGKSCLYIKRLEDIELTTLEKVCIDSYGKMKDVMDYR